MVRRAVTLFLLAMVFAPGLAQAQSKNPSFNLVNKARRRSREVYATHAGHGELGRRAGLPARPSNPAPAFAVRLREDGNCIYDIRVVFTDGKTEDRKRLDTCKLDDVVCRRERRGAGVRRHSGATPTATAPRRHPRPASPFLR